MIASIATHIVSKPNCAGLFHDIVYHSAAMLIVSRRSRSYRGILHQILDPNSSTGLMKERYICLNARLLKANLWNLSIRSLASVWATMLSMWVFQRRSGCNEKPTCLSKVLSWSSTPSRNNDTFGTGVLAKVICTVFEALIRPFQSLDPLWKASRDSCSWFAQSYMDSPIANSLVSSANSFIPWLIFFVRSWMKMRNQIGPKMLPWDTPANIRRNHEVALRMLTCWYLPVR